MSEKVMEKDVNRDKKKQRGIFLNIMILLLIIGDLQIPYYLLNPDALRTIYGSIPSWYPIYAVLGLISNIAIIIGMWKMKNGQFTYWLPILSPKYWSIWYISCQIDG